MSDDVVVLTREQYQQILDLIARLQTRLERLERTMQREPQGPRHDMGQ